MNDWKSRIRKILYPPVWLILLLVIGSTVALIYVFTNSLDTAPIAYAVYVVAFYSLTVVCIACVDIFPLWYKSAKQKIYSNQYGNRYMTDVSFKTHVSLYLSLTINLLYVAANLLSGFLYQSAWFAILAGYYMILAVMRFLLLRYVNQNVIGESRIAELKRSRLCAMILLTLNLVLSGAVLMILYQNKGYEYHGVLIYVMAAYTFYVTTHAIINMVKYRRYNSPVMSTAKSINLAAALVSMLSLETAMLSQFGADMEPMSRRIMIAATGAGVSIIVIAMSVYMIVKATKEIKASKRRKI